MTARTLTITGFSILAALLLTAAVAGRTGRLGLLPPAEILNALLSRTPVRLALVAAWAWLGWHFLAR